MTFKRPCKKCELDFKPTGAGCWICEDCQAKARAMAGIKRFKTMKAKLKA